MYINNVYYLPLGKIYVCIACSKIRANKLVAWPSLTSSVISLTLRLASNAKTWRTSTPIHFQILSLPAVRKSRKWKLKTAHYSKRPKEEKERMYFLNVLTRRNMLLVRFISVASVYLTRLITNKETLMTIAENERLIDRHLLYIPLNSCTTLRREISIQNRCISLRNYC